MTLQRPVLPGFHECSYPARVQASEECAGIVFEGRLPDVQPRELTSSRRDFPSICQLTPIRTRTDLRTE